MYEPKFTITNIILSNIGLIEAAREVVENAPLVPVYEAGFVKDAVARTVHHTTHLEVEGYGLSINQAKRVIEGEKLLARERDVQEVINYRNVVRYIENQGDKESKGGQKRVDYQESMLKEINRLACHRIIADERSGQYRDTQVVLRNSATGEVVFRPPPAIEVPILIGEFFRWLNCKKASKIHPVMRAGITHYCLVAIHPFIEANGRSARAFATLILFAEGYDIRKFFSLEEYFDKDAKNYYSALMSVDKNHRDLAHRDLSPWLEYFTRAMAVELSRIKDKVKQLSVDLKMKGRIGQQIPLNERQMKLIEHLEENGSLSTQEGVKICEGYSDDTILRDFKYFMERGLVRKVGRTKAARYVLK
jgi:Fic family protein